MKIAGIDYSSKAVHIVLLDEDTNHATDTEMWVYGDTALERVRKLRKVFPRQSWWEDNQVCLVGLEEPFSAGMKAAKALGTMRGALAALIPAELPIVETAPKEWKRILTGNPDASKETVVYHALRHWDGPPTQDVAQDTYDAFGVAYAVRELNQQAVDAA